MAWAGVSLAHRRQHPEGVAGQHDDVLGMPSQPIPGGVGDVADGVGSPGVFRQRVVIQIQASGHAFKAHIFQDGAKAPCSFINLRLGGRRQFNDLGVAASFKVEDAPVAPAVLIVADEACVWGRRTGSSCRCRRGRKRWPHLLCARRWPKQCMDSTSVGQEVVHHGEDRLFDLPGILVPPMSTIFWPKWMTMKASERVPSTSGTAWKLGALITVNSGTWAANSRPGLDEHVAGEEAVPGRLGDHPDGQSIRWVGPGEAILDEEVFPLEVSQQPVLQGGRSAPVPWPCSPGPTDFGFTGRLPHDKLARWGTPGILAGTHDQGVQWPMRASRRRMASSYRSGVERFQ